MFLSQIEDTFQLRGGLHPYRKIEPSRIFSGHDTDFSI